MMITQAQIDAAEIVDARSSAPQRAPQVQITVSVSQPLYELIEAEIGHCACSMQHFVRHAVALEVTRRRNVRNAGSRRGATPASLESSDGLSREHIIPP
jgi:hypothetical protein